MFLSLKITMKLLIVNIIKLCSNINDIITSTTMENKLSFSWSCTTNIVFILTFPIKEKKNEKNEVNWIL